MPPEKRASAEPPGSTPAAASSPALTAQPRQGALQLPLPPRGLLLPPLPQSPPPPRHHPPRLLLPPCSRRSPQAGRWSQAAAQAPWYSSPMRPPPVRQQDLKPPCSRPLQQEARWCRGAAQVLPCFSPLPLHRAHPQPPEGLHSPPAPGRWSQAAVQAPWCSSLPSLPQQQPLERQLLQPIPPSSRHPGQASWCRGAVRAPWSGSLPPPQRHPLRQRIQALAASRPPPALWVLHQPAPPQNLPLLPVPPRPWHRLPDP